MSLLGIFRSAWLLFALFFLGIANSANPPSVAPDASWHEYKSVAGHFSTRFPTKPVTRITHQESVIGNVSNHIVESKSDIGRFSVDYSDLPGFAVSFTGRDMIYRHAIGGLLKKTLGKIQSNKDIMFQGHSGKYLLYSIPQALGHTMFSGEAHLFLIDKRLYIINAISHTSSPTQQSNFFLSNLRFY